MYGSTGGSNNHCNGRLYSPHPQRQHSFLSPEEIAAGKKSHWSELELTGNIRNLSIELWDWTHLTSLYLNGNHIHRLPSAICRLANLIHLDLSNNRLRNLPPEIGEMTHLRELLLNFNQLRVLPLEIGKLFLLQKLGLEGNPLTPDIKNIYNDVGGTPKLLEYLLDHLHFTASQPQIRPWIPIGSPPMNKPVAIFTVMCYNVLCDTYCTRQLYGYCPSWALSWEYRKKAILEEIHQYSADIITLQEVETEQFYSLFLPELKQHGYAGIFSPKSRHKTMSDSEKKRVDGCAIFFKSDKFDLKKEHLVEFNQLAMSNAEGSHDMINRVMTKDNIGLCAVLETKETVWEPGLSGTGSGRQPFLVATCHIHWDPEFSDVKLIQTMLFVHELKKIADENRPITQSLRPGGGVTNNTTASGSNTSGSHIPVLLCGDFNSLPNSGVIEFLNASVVSSGHDDFRALKYEESLKRLNLDAQQQTFKHDFKLASAYEPGVMPYTNYTYDFKGVIDYIFYSRESMRPLGVLGPIDPDWFRSNKVLGCPHPHIPSDHLPLLVEIEMSPQNWPGGAASSLNTISNANSAASALSPASSATSGSGSHSSISFPVSTGNSSTALAPPHLGGFRSAGGQGYGMGGTGGYGGRQGQQRR